MYALLFISTGLFVSEVVNCVIGNCNAFYMVLSITLLIGALLATGKAEREEKLLNKQES